MGNQAEDQVCLRKVCFPVEVADQPDEHAIGLMNRKHLDEDRGMLFVFSFRYKHAFWMKNTLIPLDMIWLDHARRVVHIEENVPPCKKDPCPNYTPEHEALYVLELNAGKAREYNISPGDVFSFKLNLEKMKN